MGGELAPPKDGGSLNETGTPYAAVSPGGEGSGAALAVGDIPPALAALVAKDLAGIGQAVASKIDGLSARYAGIVERMARLAPKATATTAEDVERKAVLAGLAAHQKAASAIRDAVSASHIPLFDCSNVRQQSGRSSANTRHRDRIIIAARTASSTLQRVSSA